MRKKTIIIVSGILLYCCFVIALNLISDSKKSGIELTDLLEIQVGETEVTFVDYEKGILFQLTDEGVERLDALIKNTNITHKRENDITLVMELFQMNDDFDYFFTLFNRHTEHYITDFKFKNKNSLQIYSGKEVYNVKTEDPDFRNKFIEIIEENSYERSNLNDLTNMWG